MIIIIIKTLTSFLLVSAYKYQPYLQCNPNIIRCKYGTKRLLLTIQVMDCPSN